MNWFRLMYWFERRVCSTANLGDLRFFNVHALGIVTLRRIDMNAIKSAARGGSDARFLYEVDRQRFARVVLRCHTLVNARPSEELSRELASESRNNGRVIPGPFATGLTLCSIRVQQVGISTHSSCDPGPKTESS